MILKSSRIRICLKSKDKHTYKIEKEKTHRDTQKDTEGKHIHVLVREKERDDSGSLFKGK